MGIGNKGLSGEGSSKKYQIGEGAYNPKATQDTRKGSFTLAEYIMACCRGEKIPAIDKVAQQNPFADAIVRSLNLVGALQPLQGIIPTGGNPVAKVDKTVSVARATVNNAPNAEANADPEPTEVLALEFCAPMESALVIKYLNVEPANLTAAESGSIQYKRSGIVGFDGFCTQFEEKEKPGTIVTVENMILVPQSGFGLYVRNHDICSEALFDVTAEVWAAN